MAKYDPKRFDVYWVEEIESKGEKVGGDDGHIWSTDSKTTAFNKAKAWSLKKTVNGKPLHETFVYEYDDNRDIAGHWYFKDGKQTHSMFA